MNVSTNSISIILIGVCCSMVIISIIVTMLYTKKETTPPLTSTNEIYPAKKGVLASAETSSIDARSAPFSPGLAVPVLNKLVIEFRGDTGEEKMEIIVDGNEVYKETITKNSQNETFEFAKPISKVEVKFTNDGRTSDGKDKNIRVQKFQYNETDLLPLVDASYLYRLDKPRIEKVKNGFFAWARTYTYQIPQQVEAFDPNIDLML